MQVLNPLDAICHKPRVEAICVSQLRNAKKIDEALLQERPDVKIFLPFRFLFYKPEELFIPHTYNKFLGRELLGNDKAYVTESVLDEPSVKFENYQPFFEFFPAAVGGFHVISLVDEISYAAAPAPPLSQLEDIPPDQFCNGDNRPPDCGKNCECTHTVDIPLNAIVEVVLVDEGKNITPIEELLGYVNPCCSAIAESKSPLPSSRILVCGGGYWEVARPKCEEDQLEARLGSG